MASIVRTDELEKKLKILTLSEKKEFFDEFIQFLKKEKVNNKELVARVYKNNAIINDDLTFDEIFDYYKIKNRESVALSISEIFRQLYIKFYLDKMKESGEDFQPPVISFKAAENGRSIELLN